MKVDVLRQLDEWGTHFEDAIDHVSAAELIERGESEERAVALHEEAKQLWQPLHRRVIRYAGAFVVLIVALGGIIQLAGQAEPASEEFNSVGNALGGNNLSRSTRAPATTAAAGTFAPTTLAPDTTAAATTTLAPLSTTLPPSTTVVGTTTIPPAGGNPANLGRAVIFVADMAIDTRDVSGAVTQARAIVESRGGFVFGQELGGANTVMSLKVPAQFFQDTLDRLGELGVVRSARVTSEDVTERIVDIESQITTAEASVARLQELLRDADSINTIARLESELLDRETTLERLRGQLRTLQDQVALSTIVVTIREFVPSPDLRLGISVHATDSGTSEECFTDAGPRPEKGESYVVCLTITNTGNLELTNFQVTGPADFVDHLIPTSGNEIETLAVGDRYVLWTTAVASEPIFERFTVRAVPLDEQGLVMTENIVDRQRPFDLPVRDPQAEPIAEPESDGGLPSLRDALEAGWNVLTTGTNVLGVALAFLLPLLWIPAIGFAIYLWRRRRAYPRSPISGTDVEPVEDLAPDD